MEEDGRLLEFLSRLMGGTIRSTISWERVGGFFSYESKLEGATVYLKKDAPARAELHLAVDGDRPVRLPVDKWRVLGLFNYVDGKHGAKYEMPESVEKFLNEYLKEK